MVDEGNQSNEQKFTCCFLEFDTTFSSPVMSSIDGFFRKEPKE